MLYVKYGKNQLHGFRDVFWKCWRRTTTDGRRMPAYTISSHMSLWLRWANNGIIQRILKIAVKTLSSRKSCVLLNFSVETMQKVGVRDKKLGAKYSKFGVNENSGCRIYNNYFTKLERDGQTERDSTCKSALTDIDTGMYQRCKIKESCYHLNNWKTEECQIVGANNKIKENQYKKRKTCMMSTSLSAEVKEALREVL